MKLRDLVGSGPAPRSYDEQYTPEHVQALRTARRRVSKMSTRQMLDWADSAGSGMARAIDDYRKDRDVISLEEVRTALVALSAVIDELEARQDAEGM